ncbi:MAG: hypothetical protein H0W74_00400 [Sphingosinicella sp.]|nr:hypothetical protein [Sphingosinicella sp.]
MMTVFDANIVIIAIALLVGVVIAWWIFKHGRAPKDVATREPHRDAAAALPPTDSRPADPSPIDPRPSDLKLADPKPAPARAARATARRGARVDSPEGNSVVDQGAAATTDVAGEMLGVQAHRELAGAGGVPDNLELMKGVGPKFVARLQEHGVTRFDQLARLSGNEIAILDDKMGPFKGRLLRDRVPEQAGYLARDDRDGFEAKFGKLGPS